MKELWQQKLNFSLISAREIFVKVIRLLNNFAMLQKRKYENFNEFLSRLFDVTFKSGTWLCTIDKQFYEIQLKSGGKVGYAKGNLASLSSIHPSKRINTGLSKM